MSSLRLPGKDGFAVCDKAAFESSFEALTCGIFKGFDFSNVFVAGGAVLGSIMDITDEQRAKSFKNTDIDLFIYGLTAEQATKKLEVRFWKGNSDKTKT